VLEVTHEGTNDVKRARKHALIQEYELFILVSRSGMPRQWSKTKRG